MKTINDYAELVKEKHALNKTIAPVEADETDASKAYVVGEQLILSGILYDVIAPISQHDVITTTGSGANIAPAGPISAKIQTLTNNVGVLAENGAVNKLPNNAKTQTLGGIQVTVNADKSITISGSGNSENFDIFNDANNPIVLEKDCVYSCSATFTVSTCEIVATATDESTYSLKLSTGNKLTIPAGKSIKRVRWYNNASYDQTLTIYPMIADADYSGGYVPYAMTNKELTEKVVPEAITITPATGITIDYNLSYKIGNLAVLNFRFLIGNDVTVAANLQLATISAKPKALNGTNSLLGNAYKTWEGSVGGIVDMAASTGILKLSTAGSFVAGGSYYLSMAYVCD